MTRVVVALGGTLIDSHTVATSMPAGPLAGDVWLDTASSPATPAVAWAAPAYGAGWSAFGTGESTPGYRKGDDGAVEVMGLVKKASALVANDVILTLPVGFRPLSKRRFPTCVNGNLATTVVVDTAGAVQIESGGSASWTCLDGIRFDPAR